MTDSDPAAVDTDDLEELDVIVYCVRAIDALDELTQDRVVRWLAAHYIEQSR